MIIKIITKTKDGKQPTILYDGFARVTWRYLSEEDFNSMEVDAVWVLGDVRVCYKDKCAFPILISAKRLNESEDFTIKTDAVTYILNDEGKTIERIN